jgi:transposase, IS5 family
MLQIVTVFEHICPNYRAVYTDKGYCVKPAKWAARRKNVHLAAIKKKNMNGKNKDLDRWICAIRSPYERVFSKQRRRVRYCSVAKDQFSEFMHAICLNSREYW